VNLARLAQPDQEHLILIEFDPIIYDRPHIWKFTLSQASPGFVPSVENINGSVRLVTRAYDGHKIWYADVWRTGSVNPAKYNMVTGGVSIFTGE
jgi:hypothetical protein